MDEAPIEVRVAKSAKVSDIVALYKDAGWWDESFDESWVPGVVTGSFRFVGAFEGERMVGMARALSDGVSDAYILDVATLKSHRGRGVGRRLVETLVDELESLGMDWITGLGEPDAVGFYRKIGIETPEGYVPLRFKGRKTGNGLQP